MQLSLKVSFCEVTLRPAGSKRLHFVTQLSRQNTPVFGREQI